jgi:hypothetical protein
MSNAFYFHIFGEEDELCYQLHISPFSIAIIPKKIWDEKKDFPEENITHHIVNVMGREALYDLYEECGGIFTTNLLIGKKSLYYELTSRGFRENTCIGDKFKPV